VVVEEPMRAKIVRKRYGRRPGAVLLTSSFVLPANIFWNPIPTPSITARRTAQPMAPFLAAL
jgi:hypothetical protein